MRGVGNIYRGHEQDHEDEDIVVIEEHAHSNGRPSARPGPPKTQAATHVGIVNQKDLPHDAAAPISSSKQNGNYLDRRKDLQKRIAGIESEIQSYDEELRKIQDVRALRLREKGDLENQLEALRQQNIFGVGGNAQGEYSYSLGLRRRAFLILPLFFFASVRKGEAAVEGCNRLRI